MHAGSLIRVVVTLAAAIGALALASPAGAASPNVVISQIYGGGGNSGAQYTNDFIELFNRGSAPVDLSAWSLQYASATGTGNFGASAAMITPLTGTLQPGQYQLVEEAGVRRRRPAAACRRRAQPRAAGPGRAGQDLHRLQRVPRRPPTGDLDSSR
jgi:predicted extracellular nuclease